LDLTIYPVAIAGNKCSSATAKFGGGGSGDVPTVICDFEFLIYEHIME
jgi:hypothetical protein